jgi:hypothetical protein
MGPGFPAGKLPERFVVGPEGHRGSDELPALVNVVISQGVARKPHAFRSHS